MAEEGEQQLQQPVMRPWEAELDRRRLQHCQHVVAMLTRMSDRLALKPWLSARFQPQSASAQGELCVCWCLVCATQLAPNWQT
jgi:hypothetical protein